MNEGTDFMDHFDNSISMVNGADTHTLWSIAIDKIMGKYHVT